MLRTSARAVFGFLLAGAAAALPAAAQDGKSIYLDRCAFCHGATGKGDGPAGQALNPPPRDFTTSDFWKTADRARMREVIQNGKDGSAMVPFKQLLNDQQIDAVLEHLMSFRPAS